MDDRFDQEFYRSEWQRVLPLGPDGLQPYVRASRTSRLPGSQAHLSRSLATLGAVAQAVIAVGRFAAVGMADRLMLSASAPRTELQRPSLDQRDPVSCLCP
jgi:hypothetical protein